ncbi:hypothetical protein NL676_030601 [Syzygium grande]|nr:hypothetical protein NL676_030601 [Syzygium grande]
MLETPESAWPLEQCSLIAVAACSTPQSLSELKTKAWMQDDHSGSCFHWAKRPGTRGLRVAATRSAERVAPKSDLEGSSPAKTPIAISGK